MDIIHLLPDSVANQIAAGEVIQRPASVIKELVENAIDAGAKRIQVLVCDAGKTSIQVIDDGCGMSDTDARLSFERHATSKIRQANDLFALHTMGFRGEALASIAAVAQVTLNTRTADNEVGTRLVIAGSKVIEQEVTACPVGSNFLIENLFFNIPARRKFLKSNATEMSNITQAFERIALVYPEVEFTLHSNGMEMMRLCATNMQRRIVDVFGKRINQQLLPVETDTTLCKISGFIGKPESSKKKGCLQYFFVNGRYMKHPYFHKAVISAYDRLLPDGEQVSYFIYFTVNPEDIDVNIHPVKTEIKFDNEQAIWQILMASIRSAIGTFSGSTSLDFDTEGKPDIPLFNPGCNSEISAPAIDFNPFYNPFNASGGARASGHSADKSGASDTAHYHKESGMNSARGWEDLFPTASSVENQASISSIENQTSMLPFDDEHISVPVSSDTIIHSFDDNEHPMQLSGQYIMFSSADGLVIVDQNRASQRILFEEYMQTLNNHTAHTQKVLFPEVMQFAPSLSSELPRILEELEGLGFDITDLGGNNYSIAGVPSGLGGLDAVQLVTSLVSEAAECGANAKDEIHTILAMSLAKKAATPYGEILSVEAMRTMLRQLLNTSTPRYTPDGKIIYSIMSDNELKSRFN